MLSKLEVASMLPARDLQRARTFYKDMLGLEPAEETSADLTYQTPAGARFGIYETDNAGTAKNTALCWETPDIVAETAELRGRGVVFEEYDLPGLKTEHGVATMDTVKAAWFTDSEGNILCLSERR
ncbi:MAG: VOC family protein [Microbacteriaceae bacterium]